MRMGESQALQMYVLKGLHVPALRPHTLCPTAPKKVLGMSEDVAPVIAYGKLPNQFNFHSSVEFHVA